MKSKIFKVLIVVSIFSFSCKSSRIKLKEKELSKNIKLVFSKEKFIKCNHFCDYIKVKIINNNDVGVYIPGVLHSLFFATDLNNKIAIDGCPSDDLTFIYPFEYRRVIDLFYSKYEKNKTIYRNLVEKAIKIDIKKNVEPKIPDSIKNNKDYASKLSSLESPFWDYKYSNFFFIPANSYIEDMVYIQDVINDEKEVDSIIIKDIPKYIYKEIDNKLIFFLSDFNDDLSNKLMKIKMTYPKKIGDFYLVRRVKFKDTIISLK